MSFNIFKKIISAMCISSRIIKVFIASSFFFASWAYAVDQPGTLDDRSLTFDYSTKGNWGVYQLNSSDQSARSGDRFSTRIERRIPLFKRAPGKTQTLEAQFHISNSGETVFAQIHTVPAGPHGNVILIYAEDVGRNWRIFNDEYRQSDGKRVRKRFLGTVKKGDHLDLKLETGYNHNATRSFTRITLNGRFMGTTRHFQLGKEGLHLRYGAYRANGSDARILVRDVKVTNN